jgi:hypothetical protein
MAIGVPGKKPSRTRHAAWAYWETPVLESTAQADTGQNQPQVRIGHKGRSMIWLRHTPQDYSSAQGRPLEILRRHPIKTPAMASTAL